MPFTLSHPAAVVPLAALARRAGVPIAALAIGAMSPDFEFFFHLAPRALVSHTLPGLFAFCVPIGLLVYVLWERVGQAPVRALLAMPVARVAPIAWGAASLGVLLGAATHLLWDGITHGGYWGAELWPWLRSTAFRFGTVELPWFNLLQHVSTVVGGIIVLWWVADRARETGDIAAPWRDPARRRAVGLLALITLAAALANGGRGPFDADFWTAQRLLGRIAVGGMLGMAAGVLLLARPSGILGGRDGQRES